MRLLNKVEPSSCLMIDNPILISFIRPAQHTRAMKSIEKAKLILLTSSIGCGCILPSIILFSCGQQHQDKLQYIKKLSMINQSTNQSVSSLYCDAIILSISCFSLT
jgi:hypothetical protein